MIQVTDNSKISPLPAKSLKKGDVFYFKRREAYGLVPTSWAGTGKSPCEHAVLFFSDGGVCTLGLEHNDQIILLNGLEVIFK